MTATITDLLTAQAQQRPNAPFIIDAGAQYSYSDIYTLSRRFATLLGERGVVKGDRVALLAGNSAAYLVAWFGANFAGATAVTLNTELTGDGLQFSLRQSDPRIVVADAAWIAAKWSTLDSTLQALPAIAMDSVDDFFRSLRPYAEAPLLPTHRSDIATIVYTSGTTGLPKGVMSSHGEYAAVGVAGVDVVDLKPHDRTMVFLPLFHSNAQMLGVLPVLTAGASMALFKRFSASTFFEDAARVGATGFTFVGTVVSILAVRHPGVRRDHKLRFALGGGTPKQIWPRIEQDFGFKVNELYGMTEVGGWVTGNSARATRIGSCGKVRPDMEVRIFDENDEEVPVGMQGEIVVRPRKPGILLSGYFQNDREMVQACRNLWFHTGDRGSFDEDGYLFLHGRLKELIRRSGEMISPTEIETQLRQMPCVQDCAVVGVEDDVAGEEIKAVLVVSSAMEPAAVRSFLEGRLPLFMLPRYVEFIDVIPRTETEKILRRKLQYLNEQVHDLGSPKPPR